VSSSAVKKQQLTCIGHIDRVFFCVCNCAPSSAYERDQAFWDSCNAEDKGAIKLHHIRNPSGVMPFLWQNGNPEAVLDPLPQFMPAEEPVAQAVPAPEALLSVVGSVGLDP
jgi:hypothetical protein